MRPADVQIKVTTEEHSYNKRAMHTYGYVYKNTWKNSKREEVIKARSRYLICYVYLYSIFHCMFWAIIVGCSLPLVAYFGFS